MKDTKRNFFYFSAADFKGVQKLLEDEANKGWELADVDGFLTARFVRTERNDLTYYVDLMPQGVHPDTQEKYLRLCEDAGWELVGDFFAYRGSKGTFSLAELWIFKSKPGRHPLPVQTDAEIEEVNFREYVMKGMLYSVLSLAFLMGCWGSTFWGRFLRWNWYDDWRTFCAGIAVPLLCIYVGFRLLDLLATAAWYRSSVRKGGVLPATPRAVLYGRGVAYLLGGVPFLLVIAGLLLDAPHWEEGVLLYIVLGVIALLSLAGYAKALPWVRTKRQRKQCLAVGIVCLCSVAVLGLLDWEGPWKNLSGGGTMELVRSQLQAELKGQPVVPLEAVGIGADRVRYEYENGTSPAGSWWRYREYEDWWMEDSEGGEISSRCYRCIREEGAVGLCEDLLKRTQGGDLDTGCTLEAWELDGFDGCWYGTGENWKGFTNTLLVRQGNTVALVSSTADLLDGGNLAAVRECLGV